MGNAVLTAREVPWEARGGNPRGHAAGRIITGPNGAGKTTFAKQFLPAEADCPIFVNADLIAAGLAPFNPESAVVQAGRVILSALRKHARERVNFAFETTLSGRGYLRSIPNWQSTGYTVKLLFLKLNSSEEAAERVATRVQQGGHDIPLAVVQRRFDKGIENFHKHYIHVVDIWALYDGSRPNPTLLDWGRRR